MGLWPPKVIKTLNERNVGRRKRLPHVGASRWGRRFRFRLPTLRARTGVFNGVTMGLRPTKGDEDAL
jgi:hypothetical protein